jgi:hypothetical protein
LARHDAAEAQVAVLRIDHDPQLTNVPSRADARADEHGIADDISVTPGEQRQRPVVVQVRRPALDDARRGDVVLEKVAVLLRDAEEELEHLALVGGDHRLQLDDGAAAQPHLLWERFELVDGHA